MEPETSTLDLAAERITEQMGRCHDAVLGVFKYAAKATDPEVQLSAMRAATQMMQISANAASALARLKGIGTRHTVAVVRDRGEPPPQS
jgi:hypothetical protein